jgi:hypothetical protein
VGSWSSSCVIRSFFISGMGRRRRRCILCRSCVGLPDGGVKQGVLDRLVAHFRRSPAGVSGGSGAGGDANVTSVGIMTLHDSSSMALCTRSSNYM